MSYQEPPFSRGMTDADADANLKAGFQRLMGLPWLQIALWCAAGIFILRFFYAWLWWIAALGLACTLAYTYRDAPFVKLVREALWNFVMARILGRRRAYAHAYEKTDSEQRLADFEGEIARIAAAEQSNTVEAGLFLANARPAMEAELDRLLRIPKPTPAEHKERVMLEQWLAADRAKAGGVTAAAQAALDLPERRGGWLSALNAFASKWALWLVSGLAIALGAQTVRAEWLKLDGKRTRDALAQAQVDMAAMAGRIDRDAERIQALADARARDALRFADAEAAAVRRIEEQQRREARLRASVRRLEDARDDFGGGDAVDFRDQLHELAEPADDPAAGTDAGAGTADSGL